MCGIAGIVSAHREAERWISRMLAVQAHRGPDGSGIWRDKSAPGGLQVVLGHRRLSILDLSDAGAQPMVDCTGHFVLTYNGEIYNYLEIRDELRKRGVGFRSNTDTEVLLEAYKHWGAACLERFNGMFAFALYDRLRGVVFCARDRYGEKPFLFHQGPGGFVFASEYKALLQCPEIGLAVDEERLVTSAYRISYGLDSDRQTVFSAVQQLLPSEALELDISSGQTRIWRYWQIEPKPLRQVSDEREVFGEFRELLTDAVRLRMRSDVPVGSCLSGGMDSTAIVCIARQLLGRDSDYHTFTGRFPGTHADEWSYASQVVEQTGVTSHIVEPGVARFMEELPEFIWHNELPVGNSSQVAQWCVFELAKRQGITVLLDGQGADEGLGGYDGYFRAYVKAMREMGETEQLARELPLIRARYPSALVPSARALRDRLPLGARHWASRRFGMGGSFLFGLRLDLARKVQEEVELVCKPGFNALSSTLEQNSFGRFLTTLLRYGDRNSMAHSREVRLPFCDHRIAEFVHGLPPRLLMGDAQNKRLLRESMRGILPEGVRTRWAKQGFVPPQELWFENPRFMQLVRDTLHSDAFRQNPVWQHNWWERALDRLEAGERALARTVWRPFIQTCWRQHFVGELARMRARTEAALPESVLDSPSQ